MPRVDSEKGCTAHEIMAVLGHKTLAEAQKYTRDADQLRLAGAAITKLEGRKKNRVASLGKCRSRKENQNDAFWIGAP